MMSSVACSTSYLVFLPCCAWSAVWHFSIGSPGVVVVPYEWSIGTPWYYSRTVAAMSACLVGYDDIAYLHVL
jgi:hypothetical protein